MTRNYALVDHATQAYIAVVGLLILVCHNTTVLYWQWLLAGHVLLFLSIHGLIKASARPPKNQALSLFRHFYPVLLYTFFFLETGLLNRMFFAEYLDPQLILWEQAVFQCQPSILFMEKLPYLAVSELFYAAYFSYYVMIAGVGIALFVRSRQQFYHYVSVISLVFYICYALYILFPVIGPPVFFNRVPGYDLPDAIDQLAPTHSYPEVVTTGPFYRVMGLLYRLVEGPGAAIPSSHVAIALCTVYFSFRYLPRIRYLHLAVATLLCLSTIYCRYHYVLDVVAGVLTAATLVPLANWLYLRSTNRSDILPNVQSEGPSTTRKPMPKL